MTYNRLIKRRVLLLGLLFLLMTGVFAPAAFFAGIAKGAQLTADVSQNEPNTASYGDYSGQEIICGWTGKTRDAELEAFCHPFFHARGTGVAGNGVKTAPAFITAAYETTATGPEIASAMSGGAAHGGPSPLNDAVNAFVADLADDQSAPANPLSLALAPGGSGGSTTPFGSQPFYFGGGYPDVVVPGFVTGLPPVLTPEDEFPAGNSGNPGNPNNPGNPAGSGNPTSGGPPVTGPGLTDPIVPEVIVTPLPGAIALWISGAFALLIAVRRRKKASD